MLFVVRTLFPDNTPHQKNQKIYIPSIFNNQMMNEKLLVDARVTTAPSMAFN